VGEEIHAQFAGARVGERNLDLPAIARRQLLEAGAAEVHDVGLCTMCAGDELFFSHRRDGGITGRQAGVVWREGGAGSAGRDEGAA
jgi:purine-nucleoside/S-methyl-5'-thioadenosine phosphorylase / adenosine deaminase